MGRDETIDSDGTLLSNAVGAVCRLVLNGGVPPRVKVDDIVSSREVQSQAACFEADEEERHVAMLKLLHQPGALLGGGGSVQIEIFNAPCIKFLAYECQVGGELAEDQGAVVAFPELFSELQEGFHFGGGNLHFGVYQSCVAGSLS